MKACRYSRKLYAGLSRAAYLHGKQSLARLSDVLILWKQFLRRCASDKDAAVSGVVVCTEGKGINQHDRKIGILSPRWWINGRNVARNAMRASLCYTISSEKSTIHHWFLLSVFYIIVLYYNVSVVSFCILIRSGPAAHISLTLLVLITNLMKHSYQRLASVRAWLVITKAWRLVRFRREPFYSDSLKCI